MKYNLLFSFVILTSQSCKTKLVEKEDAFNVAKAYCNCVEEQLVNAKDSSVNLNDCEDQTFANSRLVTIYSDFNNRERYSSKTLDSASKFALQVRNITDTLCYNKIDFKKIKKILHIKM